MSHISFEASATSSGGGEGTMCNSPKERDEVSEVQGGRVLKRLGGPTVEQEDKGLHRGAGGQIRGQVRGPGLGTQARSQGRRGYDG